VKLVTTSEFSKGGVIGIGAVGGGVAQCLARAGLLAGVYARRPETATAIPGLPPSVASPAALAALCDVILIAVVDAKQTIDVLTGTRGVLAGARPNAKIVLLSTVSLRELNKIRNMTNAAGLSLVDAPVIGAARAANNGIVCLVGATQNDLDQIRTVLEGFTLSIAHMGGPGAGMAAKLARNILVYTAWRGAYEAALLATSAGVDVHQLAEAVDLTGALPGGSTTWLRRPQSNAEAKRTQERAFGLFRKDMAAALDLADELGLDLPVTRLAFDSAAKIVGADP
jgi:3-hydroxyisobutyrate dehydrogenase